MPKLYIVLLLIIVAEMMTEGRAWKNCLRSDIAWYFSHVVQLYVWRQYLRPEVYWHRESL